jgi:hypothetical protein
VNSSNRRVGEMTDLGSDRAGVGFGDPLEPHSQLALPGAVCLSMRGYVRMSRGLDAMDHQPQGPSYGIGTATQL